MNQFPDGLSREAAVLARTYLDTGLLEEIALHREADAPPILLSARHVPGSWMPSWAELASPRLPAALRAARPGRRGDFLASRAVAAVALAALGHDRLEVGRGEMGEPLWPQGVSGALAAGGGRVAALVRSGGERAVGLDIASPLDGQKLAFARSEALIPADGEALAASDLPDSLAVALAQAAKNALFRAAWALGGTSLGYAGVAVETVGAAQIGLRLVESAGPALPAGRAFAVQVTAAEDSAGAYSLVWLDEIF